MAVGDTARTRRKVPSKPKTPAEFESRAQVVKALAHPTRLFVVDDLARNGERCVCELTRMIGADISTVSKHLGLLRQAGIVVDEKRGNMVFYRLAAPCVSQFFQCIESVLQAQARGGTPRRA